ncbi:MAG: S8 family peptidase [Cyclobacteriaceae bacterium]
MNKRGPGILLTLLLSLFILPSFAFQAEQENEGQDTTAVTAVPTDWYLKDPETDSVQGVSSERAYSTLLKGKPSRTVIVAVIDSGVDIEHEDLKDNLWRNEDEVAGNGQDDDKNGYVDDVHGWNFIGGKEGNVDADTYEVTREYARLKPKYGNVEEKDVSKKNRAEYGYWKEVKDKYERDSKFNKEQYDQYVQQYQLYTNAFLTIHYCDSLLQRTLGQPVTKSSLSSVDSTNDTINFAKQTLSRILESVEGDVEVSVFLQELAGYIDQLKEGVAHYETAVEFGYNTEFDSRAVVGDDPSDLDEKYYGNNDVEGPDARHGTHVAGIIGANRKNDIGVKGIADNVKIMSVRAVPNGDERDKDVANAIRYAVDNGAHIINMSFGKSFSPNKELVDKAVKYAESKGVLLIHAAGNDGDDLDQKANFPNRTYTSGGQAKSWLEIGASSWGADENFVGSFSNYGKKSVDLFAPGVQIYSTTPDDTYENLQGTSMAAPATSGVAAIIMSYFPELTAEQVKDILRQSTRRFDGLKVTKPGSKEEVAFNQLSSSGGMVNAYEAVKVALTVKEVVGGTEK